MYLRLNVILCHLMDQNGFVDQWALDYFIVIKNQVNY